MENIDYIGKIVNVKIDRQLGSKHPKYDFIYLVNYGYVPNTVSGDGEELDCYVLGIYEPILEFTGKCIAVIHRTNDNDDKLIIVPEEKEYSDDAIEALIEFQEKFFEHEIIRKDVEFNSLIPELSVSDIERSKAFYQKIGFKVMYERKEEGFAFLQLEKNQLMIERQNDNWNTGEMEYPFGRGINVSMMVHDVQKMYDRLKDLGVKMFVNLEVHTYQAGGKVYEDKEFLIQDPDGYLLRFND